MTLEGLICNVRDIAKKNLNKVQHIIQYHKICFVFVVEPKISYINAHVAFFYYLNFHQPKLYMNNKVVNLDFRSSISNSKY